MKTLNISHVDTFFVNGSYPIEFLLFYKNKIPTKKIFSALKKLSGLFWPAFGHYDAGKIFGYNYNEPEFFNEETRQNDFDLRQPPEIILNNYRNLIPAEINKLFYLKIIHYKNGTALIAKMNHLAGDGYSYFYILSLLAQFSRNNFIPLRSVAIRYHYRPHHDRNCLKPFIFTGKSAFPLADLEKPVLEFETVSKKTIMTRIKKIGEKFNQSVSTNDLLCAMVMKKTLEFHAGKFKNTFQLSLPIDIRQKIVQYGPRFFGNGLMFHHIHFSIQEIIQTDVENLAIQIRQNMPQLSKGTYRNYLEQIEENIFKKQIHLLRPYDPENGSLVTNLSRLPTHKLNFGKGKPDLTLLLTVGKNSAAILANGEEFILRYVY